MSLIVGSEGMLGIVTNAWLKILPIPKYIKTASAAFGSIADAMTAVTRIIGGGIVPRALEAMDKVSLDASLSGKTNPFPAGTEAVLIIELDGHEPARIKKDLDAVEKICRENSCSAFTLAEDDAQRDLLWAARKGAYPALARLAPDVLVEDGVVPRPLLPEALRQTREILSKYKITAGLLFHAGDGNLHPNMIFDRRDLQAVRRVKMAGHEILRACIKLGGTISGEHGIGVEKRVAMNWLYGPEELEFFRKIKRAFDPKDLANPDKILPVGAQAPARPAGLPERASLSPEARGIVDELTLRARTGERTAVTGLGTRLKPGKIMEGTKPLDLKLLRSPAAIDRENLTARAEAGLPFKEFREQLREAGLYLDLPEFDGSVGGVIASKASPQIGGLLLGLEMACPDGTVLELGGKTVKNVAGYDAVRLLCGSLGAYGVILAATFALSASKPKGHAEPPAPGSFEPGEYQRRLKKVFDPANLLNPWIFRNL